MFFKEKIFVIFSRISDFIERQLYLIPVLMAFFALLIMCYAGSYVLSSADQANRTIETIPVLIQEEFEYTRDVLHSEGSATRENLLREHTMTRSELMSRIKTLEVEKQNADKERLRLMDSIQKLIVAQQETQTQLTKHHHRILGIF